MVAITFRFFIGSRLASKNPTNISEITENELERAEFTIEIDDVYKNNSLCEILELSANSEARETFREIVEKTALSSNTLISYRKWLDSELHENRLIFNCQYFIYNTIQQINSEWNVFNLNDDSTKSSYIKFFDFNVPIINYIEEATTITLAPVYLREWFLKDEGTCISADSANTTSDFCKYAKLINFRTISATTFLSSAENYTEYALQHYLSDETTCNNWSNPTQIILTKAQAQSIFYSKQIMTTNYPLYSIKEYGFDKSSGQTYTTSNYRLSTLEYTSVYGNGIQNTKMLMPSGEINLYSENLSFTYFYCNPSYKVTIYYKPSGSKELYPTGGKYPDTGLTAFTYNLSYNMYDSAMSISDNDLYVCETLDNWINSIGERVGSSVEYSVIYNYKSSGEEVFNGEILSGYTSTVNYLNTKNVETGIAFTIAYKVVNVYTVNFYDLFGNSIDKQYIKEEKSAVEPEYKDKYGTEDGYNFIGWETSAWTYVTKNLDVKSKAAPKWEYLLSEKCNTDKIDEIFNTEYLSENLSKNEIKTIKSNLSECCTGYAYNGIPIVGYGEEIIPFNPEGGDENDEVAADSVINIKNMEIIFKPKKFKEETRKYLEERALAYIEEMIPSTTIFSYKFEGDKKIQLPSVSYYIDDQSGATFDCTANTWTVEVDWNADKTLIYHVSTESSPTNRIVNFSLFGDDDTYISINKDKDGNGFSFYFEKNAGSERTCLISGYVSTVKDDGYEGIATEPIVINTIQKACPSVTLLIFENSSSTMTVGSNVTSNSLMLNTTNSTDEWKISTEAPCILYYEHGGETSGQIITGSGPELTGNIGFEYPINENADSVATYTAKAELIGVPDIESEITIIQSSATPK